jgi:hypothetical protein
MLRILSVILFCVGSFCLSQIHAQIHAQVPLTGAGPSGSLCSPIAAPSGGTFDSANFSAFSATDAASLAANQILSPACTTTGATITEDSTASSVHFAQATVTASIIVQQYTFTSWVKQNNIASGARNYYVQVFSTNFSSNAIVGVALPGCTINIAAGANGSFTSATATVSAISNGWCKVALHYTDIVDTGVNLVAGLSSGTATSYSGNGTSNVGAWGADFRPGIGP